jgi:hypothetical protein
MMVTQLGRVIAFSIVGLPLAACVGPGTTTGAAGGAVAGAVVGGPVGAVVGGVAGGAVGATVTGEELVRTREVVVAENRPVARARIRGDLAAGSVLPETVAVYPVPRSARLRERYDYANVNGRYYLVRPGTRVVVSVLE